MNFYDKPLAEEYPDITKIWERAFLESLPAMLTDNSQEYDEFVITNQEGKKEFNPAKIEDWVIFHYKNIRPNELNAIILTITNLLGKELPLEEKFRLYVKTNEVNIQINEVRDTLETVLGRTPTSEEISQIEQSCSDLIAESDYHIDSVDDVIAFFTEENKKYKIPSEISLMIDNMQQEMNTPSVQEKYTESKEMLKSFFMEIGIGASDIPNAWAYAKEFCLAIRKILLNPKDLVAQRLWKDIVLQANNHKEKIVFYPPQFFVFVERMRATLQYKDAPYEEIIRKFYTEYPDGIHSCTEVDADPSYVVTGTNRAFYGIDNCNTSNKGSLVSLGAGSIDQAKQEAHIRGLSSAFTVDQHSEEYLAKHVLYIDGELIPEFRPFTTPPFDTEKLSEIEHTHFVASTVDDWKKIKEELTKVPVINTLSDQRASLLYSTEKKSEYLRNLFNFAEEKAAEQNSPIDIYLSSGIAEKTRGTDLHVRIHPNRSLEVLSKIDNYDPTHFDINEIAKKFHKSLKIKHSAAAGGGIEIIGNDIFEYIKNILPQIIDKDYYSLIYEGVDRERIAEIERIAGIEWDKEIERNREGKKERRTIEVRSRRIDKKKDSNSIYSVINKICDFADKKSVEATRRIQNGSDFEIINMLNSDSWISQFNKLRERSKERMISIEKLAIPINSFLTIRLHSNNGYYSSCMDRDTWEKQWNEAFQKIETYIAQNKETISNAENTKFNKRINESSFPSSVFSSLYKYSIGVIENIHSLVIQKGYSFSSLASLYADLMTREELLILVHIILGNEQINTALQAPHNSAAAIKALTPLVQRYFLKNPDKVLEKLSNNKNPLDLREWFISTKNTEISRFTKDNVYRSTLPPSVGRKMANQVREDDSKAYNINAISRVRRPGEEQDSSHQQFFTMKETSVYNPKNTPEFWQNAYDEFFNPLFEFGVDIQKLRFKLNTGGAYTITREDYPDHVPDDQRKSIDKNFIFKKDTQTYEYLKARGITDNQIEWIAPEVKVSVSEPMGEEYMGTQAEVCVMQNDGTELEIGFCTRLEHKRVYKGTEDPYYADIANEFSEQSEGEVLKLHLNTDEYEYKKLDGAFFAGVLGVERCQTAITGESLQEQRKVFYDIFLDRNSNKPFTADQNQSIYKIIDLSFGIQWMLEENPELQKNTHNKNGSISYPKWVKSSKNPIEKELRQLLNKIEREFNALQNWDTESKTYTAFQSQSVLEDILNLHEENNLQIIVNKIYDNGIQKLIFLARYPITVENSAEILKVISAIEVFSQSLLSNIIQFSEGSSAFKAKALEIQSIVHVLSSYKEFYEYVIKNGENESSDQPFPESIRRPDNQFEIIIEKLCSAASYDFSFQNIHSIISNYNAENDYDHSFSSKQRIGEKLKIEHQAIQAISPVIIPEAIPEDYIYTPKEVTDSIRKVLKGYWSENFHLDQISDTSTDFTEEEKRRIKDNIRENRKQETIREKENREYKHSNEVQKTLHSQNIELKRVPKYLMKKSVEFLLSKEGTLYEIINNKDTEALNIPNFLYYELKLLAIRMLEENSPQAIKTLWKEFCIKMGYEDIVYGKLFTVKNDTSEIWKRIENWRK